jgi:precorrin-6A/cobalt-precorrin-6A reductase
MRAKILILGGTTEARQLAQVLAKRDDVVATMSLAGRTASPAAQAIPTRSGGFGGVEGLADYLRSGHIDALIDATHPYARIISANAVQAAQRTGTPLLALRRPPWLPVEGDRWIEVSDAHDAVRQLGAKSKRVFLAVGRQELAPFSSAPQHHYFIRSVDPVEPPLAVPHANYILARGPFTENDDAALLRSSSIEAVVAKNSGGAATYGKIAAARALGVPVLLFRRPPEEACPFVTTVDEAMRWIAHALCLDDPRGV